MQDTSNIGYIGKALDQLGYTQTTLTLGAAEYRQFHKDGVVRWMTSITPALSYPTTHNAVRTLSRDKTMANSFVEQLGYSIPKTVAQDLLGDRDEAYSLLDRAKKIIVKPNTASMSRGLTLNITERGQLDTALGELASSNDTDAVVQEQVHGEEIRFAVIDGELKGAILRQAAQVIGDGINTVAQLIQQENALRAAIIDTAVPYPSLETIVDEEMLSRTDIPAQGEVIRLASGTMIRTGASMYDITQTIHPSYKAIVESIAQSIPAGFIVIDLLVADYKQAADESPYWFIEFNTSPVLKLFYACRDGKHFDAATHLAQYIDKVVTK